MNNTTLKNKLKFRGDALSLEALERIKQLESKLGKPNVSSTGTIKNL